MIARTLGAAGIAALMLTSWAFIPAQPNAEAVIHEIVAAYCSGGGHGAITADGFLEPPGLTDPAKPSFAAPVRKKTVDNGFPDITIGTSPSFKFDEGANVFELNTGTASHPSFEHCPNATLPAP